MPVEFSVIVPTFHREKTLVEAVTSVLGQTGATVEVFVIDDSPEGSAQDVIASLQDARVTYLKNPNSTGGVPSVVRNIGWPRARGIYVHFLDDDDIIPEGHYAEVKAAFSEHPEVGVVFGRIEPFGNCSQTQLQQERGYFADAARRALRCRWFGPRWGFAGQMFFDRPLLVCSAGVVRHECVTRLGGFDPEIRLMEDADFYARAMRNFGAYFMDRIVLHYRIGRPSLMHTPKPEQWQLQHQRVGRRRMQAKYLKERGALEFYTLALFARALTRVF